MSMAAIEETSAYVGARCGLNGRVALVTGASGLLGGAIAQELARRGATIAAAYHRAEDAAEAVVTSIRAGGGACEPFAANLCAPEDRAFLVARVLEACGALDIVVHAAGIKARGLFVGQPREATESVLTANFIAVVELTRAALRPMIRNRRGRIVVIGSLAGSSGFPGQAAYAGSKAAVAAWARSIAGEVGRCGITVNVVAPGVVEEPGPGLYSGGDRQRVLERIALGRAGRPQEIASVVAFLASDDAAYVTGAIIPVDGGARL